MAFLSRSHQFTEIIGHNLIMMCLLSFVLNLCMLLTATKITFSTIKEFCQRKSVLKNKKVTVGKFYWTTTELSRSPPYYY